MAALGSAVINNAEMDADNFDLLNADQKLCQYERQITTVYIAWVFAGFQGQSTVTSNNDGRH